jgi:tight adherence protein D
MNIYFIAVIILILTGCTTMSNTANNSTVDMEKVKNYPGLINEYKNRLALDSNDFNTMFKLANVYYLSGDIESSAFYVNYIVDNGSENSEVYYLLGKVLDDRGEIKKSIRALSRAESLGYTDPDLNVRLGIVLGKNHNFERAEKQFKEARIKGYDDFSIKNNLAVIYLAQNKYKEVIDILLPLYNIYNNNVTINANLSVALIKIGDYEQAYEVLKDSYSDEQLNILFKQVSYLEVAG